MNDLYFDGFGEVIELIRKKKYQEVQELLSREQDRFTSTEVQLRRRGVDTIVRSIVQIDIQIKAINKQMELISGPGSRELSEIIKDYLIELKSEKGKLESLKRSSARMK